MSYEDKQRCELIKDRAMTFAKTFIYWFADNGEAVPYVRSLTYRFAQCAFWSACLLADIRPFSVSVPKTVIPSIKYEIRKGTNEFKTYIYEV